MAKKTALLKPSKIVRKLELSKQTLTQLAADPAMPSPTPCTRRATGCWAHTC